MNQWFQAILVRNVVVCRAAWSNRHVFDLQIPNHVVGRNDALFVALERLLLHVREWRHITTAESTKLLCVGKSYSFIGRWATFHLKFDFKNTPSLTISRRSICGQQTLLHWYCTIAPVFLTTTDKQLDWNYIILQTDDRHILDKLILTTEWSHANQHLWESVRKYDFRIWMMVLTRKKWIVLAHNFEFAIRIINEHFIWHYFRCLIKHNGWSIECWFVLELCYFQILRMQIVRCRNVLEKLDGGT